MSTGMTRLCRLCLVKYVESQGTKRSIVRTREKWDFKDYLSTSVRNYILTICSLQLVDISLSPQDLSQIGIRHGNCGGHGVMILPP